MVSKAAVVGIYQKKLELLATSGIELLTVVPASWKDERGELVLERTHTRGYTLEVLPLFRNGDFHLHAYRGLGGVMARFQPDIVHIDEEPYNLAAWQAHWHARRIGAKSIFFTWQNLLRRYPPPFSWGEGWVLNTADALIAGTDDAANVWRAKGYMGRLAVIPQFGTDSTTFHRAEARPQRPFTIGYVGRLVEEKGLLTLLDAFAQLDRDAQLIIVGGGPLCETLTHKATERGLEARIDFRPQVPSADIAAQYHDFDVLVLPSLTRPNWKEQFGRVLVEAMMSGVPVIGSNSGAIPSVIGEAGLIVPESDIIALAGALTRLRDDEALRAQLATEGRTRALAHFTHEEVVMATLALYDTVTAAPVPA